MAAESTGPVDVVVTWVDPTDPAWQREQEQYRPRTTERGVVVEDGRASRYRDWGTLRYVLRSIELYAPWVRTVHFVTYGHLPAWLDTSNPRLRVVRHEDYVPADYLPTFGSPPLELNLHRLEGLSEQFVLFNDDTLLLKPTRREDFFHGGLPRLVPHLEPATVARNSWFFARVSNAAVINSHFSKHAVLARHPLRWFNPRYPKESLSNLMQAPFGPFSGFRERHLPDPYLKSTFAQVWEAEPELLDEICSHRFRTNTDPNIWLVQDWQLATNEFAPGNPGIGKVFFIFGDSDAEGAADYIRRGRGRLVCVNDHVDSDDEALYLRCRQTIVAALEERMPQRSSFELAD